MVDEGFDVHAMHIYTGFSGPVRRDIQRGGTGEWTPPQAIVDGVMAIGAHLVALDRSDEFLDTLLNPRYGYGSAANPVSTAIVSCSNRRGTTAERWAVRSYSPVKF